MFIRYEEPVFRPPSEARSLILQATIGCSQNQCRFCGMYKMKKYRVRTLDELRRDLDTLPVGWLGQVQRVFLADGDALAYPQAGLVAVLELLHQRLPRLTRIACYASPRSLAGKSVADLQALRALKMRIFYFGLESGDNPTLALVNKGYTAEQMLQQCMKAKAAGIKLSITAILGLAGRKRSREHAEATGRWVTEVSPEYFSLLTMFKRHNDAYFDMIEPLSHGEIITEVLQVLRHLNPQRTILRSNHVSNFLNLAGSYPKDRDKLITQVEQVLAAARGDEEWFNQVPDYQEEYY